MKLSDFLSEKAMNMATFSSTEKRLGAVAKVGFEFEVCVKKDSPFYVEDEDITTPSLDISNLSTYDEFYNLFVGPRSVWREIDTDYESWKEASKFAFVDDAWSDYVDEDAGIDEEAAKEAAGDEWERRYSNKHSFEDWIVSEFGRHRSYFINNYNLAPSHGWVDESQEEIYTEEPKEQEEQAQTRQTLANALEKAVSSTVVVHSDYHEKPKEDDTWYVEPDSSIEGGVGLEIVSPPLPLSAALADLEKVCALISRGASTNKSTGFHINISIPGIETKLDTVKLALFMGENYAAEIFNRVGNKYTQLHLQQLMTRLKASGIFPNGFEQMQQSAARRLTTDKYFSVNFGRLDDGYLEFRVAGGAGYEQDVQQLRKTVLRFVTAVEIACDPTAEKQEYVKKLVKIFNSAFDISAAPSETLPKVPLELARIVKIATGISDQLEIMKDENSTERHKKTALIKVMSYAVTATKNIGSQLSIKELTFLKRKAKELQLTAADVDGYFGNFGEQQERTDFKRVYRI